MSDQLSKVVRKIALEMKAHRAMGSRIEELDSWSRQLNEAIESAAALPAVPEVCVWTFDDDEHAPMWTSPCGVTYSFTEGGPEDNGHKFCHSCGKPLVLAATPAHDQPEGSDNE